MSTSAAKEAYGLRKQLVEPVFGIIKEQQGARRFLLRGLANVAAEWTVLATAFSLRTLLITCGGPGAPAPSSSYPTGRISIPLPDPNWAGNHPSPIHRHLQLSRQGLFNKSHRLNPTAPTSYPLHHFWDRLNTVRVGPTKLDEIKNFHLAVQVRGVGPGKYRRRLTLWGSSLTEAIGAYHPCYRRRIISPDRREPGATLEMYIDIGDPDATMSQSRYYDDMTTPSLRPTSPAQCGTFSSSSAWPEVRERGDSRGTSTVRGLPPRRC